MASLHVPEDVEAKAAMERVAFIEAGMEHISYESNGYKLSDLHAFSSEPARKHNAYKRAADLLNAVKDPTTELMEKYDELLQAAAVERAKVVKYADRAHNTIMEQLE
jgi:hypothetical protein